MAVGDRGGGWRWERAGVFEHPDGLGEGHLVDAAHPLDDVAGSAAAEAVVAAGGRVEDHGRGAVVVVGHRAADHRVAPAVGHVEPGSLRYLGERVPLADRVEVVSPHLHTLPNIRAIVSAALAGAALAGGVISAGVVLPAELDGNGLAVLIVDRSACLCVETW